MKALQGCLGILKTASIGGGFLFFTRSLPKCLGVGLEEPMWKYDLGANVAMDFRAEHND